MRHDENDDTNAVLETLNDPLLTILGVLLMASLWLILPRESDSAVPDSGPYLQLTHTSDSLALQIEAEAREAAALKGRLANLETDIADALILQEQGENVRRDKADAREDLLGQLAQVRKETTTLQAELDQSVEEEVEFEFGYPLSKATSKTPTVFYVHGEYVAPMDEDYFTFEWYGSDIKCTRVKDGISVQHLGNPLLEFARSMKTLQPESDCVYFLVRNSGFDTFRAARQMALDAGLQIGWEPVNPEPEGDIVWAGDDGRGVTVSP